MYRTRLEVDCYIRTGYLAIYGVVDRGAGLSVPRVGGWPVNAGYAGWERLRRLPYAFAASRSFSAASITFCAACAGTSSWCEKDIVNVPRPCVMERRSAE